MEEQFRQAQKMEAIGRLAGGVAHDFNNLLTIITGNANLALLSVNQSHPLRKELEQIKNAADRAANLTCQLLAFSRKQTLQLKILDLNSIIHNMDRMLGRLIREDIEFETLLEPDLWKVKVDRGQIEQVILNLAVNASEAMSEGGHLTIETVNVELEKGLCSLGFEIVPGFYVMFSISDTGCGMTEATKAKIFEPFFTTKLEDAGTGLGLATVFGIIKQSGGHILVESESGKGTTFKVYLPKVEGEAETSNHNVRSDDLPGGGERILVVEDEDEVRYLVVRVLERLGYTVKEAGCGPEAIKLCSEADKLFDLIITDLVMPIMKGTELIKIIQKEFYPEIKVLYISGYITDSLFKEESLYQNPPYLQKPFGPRTLAQKTRDVLDGKCD